MNVLITGGTGWLGRALSEVVGRRHAVRVFDLEPVSKREVGVDAPAAPLVGSVTDFEAVQAATSDQDAVIHAAVADTWPGLYEVGDPHPFDVNVWGTYNVLDAARREGIKRIILIAAAETHVDHPPGTFIDRNKRYAGTRNGIYDLTKRLQEEIARWFVEIYGLDILAIRLGSIVDVKLGRLKHGESAWKNSIETNSWIDRYDVGEACLRALEKDHRGWDVFHLIGAPEAKRIFDVSRTEACLGVQLTTDFDRRPGSERDG